MIYALYALFSTVFASRYLAINQYILSIHVCTSLHDIAILMLLYMQIVIPPILIKHTQTQLNSFVNTEWLSTCTCTPHNHTPCSKYSACTYVTIEVYSLVEMNLTMLMSSRSTAAGSQEWHHSWWDTCPGLWPMCTRAKGHQVYVWQ